ncbi:MAG: antibiotic biosynthesis monooxygenase [Candidatus Acidiferrales bacterium]
MFQIVWEFIVRADRVSDFEKSYAAAGDWAALFRRSAGFLGTALLRDADDPRRYLTIDRWDAAASHATMRARFAKEYEALDGACAGLTESERQVGIFEDV